ncbi:MetQ/NlpA family ABC transporter substrate-binding protein [Actinoalloteichus hymeniacidonis]|uniref:ABC-type metal ion transport system, periplasmic component/surface antigen n=1 Tax=Actinoalloteichus hymeniacidonis TaxID=340345 RepID=A0AAC9HQ62_9PSEU|nr:MetQ/NlpA family ABC transporter substrate-binding protein [Actinoalloteichus hymeniacidonis]AOS63532.1 ABC-type metal ion transport system, periplasmic component/surface antigen [Actinoalloteichus hymeniacidonis]MBB5908424.1 D-methionine transport system substrate-binding protein [Actinoalloteichus hymeniacidonis]
MSENDAPSTGGPSALPEKPRKNRLGLVLGTAAVVVAVALSVFFLVKPGDDGTGGGERQVVRIGVTDAAADHWATFRTIAAEEGIEIELVNFSDYNQANPALSQGQVDLNQFQHLLFLANYNVANDDTLAPLSSTFVVPLSLYSQRHSALADIPNGAEVAIPNDATNQARALLVLQQAGLVELTGGGTVLSTPADIDQAASKVTVTPVDAAQTVASLPSVDAAIVNNNFALDAELDLTGALYSDDPESPEAEPYINIFAVRSADVDNPLYRRVAEIFADERVIEQSQAQSQGTSVRIDRPQTELAEILDRLTQTVRDSQE